MIDITSWLLAALALVGFGSFVVLFQERFIYFPVRYALLVDNGRVVIRDCSW